MSLPLVHGWNGLWALAWVTVLLVGCRPGTPAGGSGAARPPTPVRVAEAKTQAVSETLSLVGSLIADEMVEIKSETDGTVAEILFQEGQAVEKGQLLIRLDETKLAASLAEAEANYELSEANYNRNKGLFDANLISRQEFDQVQAAYHANEAGVALKKRQLQDTRIEAPFAGIVGARSISPGQVIARNTTMTWLVDLDPVKIDISVPERFLGQLALGQRLQLKLAAFPDQALFGEVYFIAPFVDPNTRTALIKARIPNPDGKLIPGMFATLDLTLRIRESSLVIPEQAIFKLLEEERALVYIVDGEQKAQLRPVKLGMRMPGEVEVLQGLQAGDKVITEGTQKIGPGSPVQVTVDAPAPPVVPGGPEKPEKPIQP